MASVQTGALVEAIEICVRQLFQFLVQMMVQLVQNDVKLHHGTVAVHVLHAGVHVLFVPRLTLVSSELHPVAYSIGLLLSPTSSFLRLQHGVTPAQHPSATSLTDMTVVLFLVD